MGGGNRGQDKKRKLEKLQKSLVKKKQEDLTRFMQTDPYMSKSAHFESAREELDKLKGKNDGINNHRGNANRRNRERERREDAKSFGMFGQLKD